MMRAGTPGLQHMLTLEAAVVLKNAVADARRRGHPLVQPLHVAAMLLASPESPLRLACIQSHPYAASHPLQCRALELCFNVALERLPASGATTSGLQLPGLGNALVAALKRAQAQQRRGCPEQQQQPLLSLRVEMEHLIISILDDPSVSRVMREAGYDSTQVKSNMEDAAFCSTSQASASSRVADSVRGRVRVAASQLPRDLSQQVYPAALPAGNYVRQLCHSGRPSGRLRLAQECSDSCRNYPWQSEMPISNDMGISPLSSEDISSVVQILLKQKKRNPILIGDSAHALNYVVQDLAHRIERGAVPKQLQGVQFLSPKFGSLASGMLGRDDLDAKLRELDELVDRCMPAGALLYLGDMHWLVERMSKGVTVFCPVQLATLELGRLLLLHGSRRFWVIGTASLHTYMSCQTHHPSLESLWGLQPVQIGLELSLPLEPGNLGNGNCLLELLPEKPTKQCGTHLLKPTADEVFNTCNESCRDVMGCYQERILPEEQGLSKFHLESTSSSSMLGDECNILESAVQKQKNKQCHNQNGENKKGITKLIKNCQQTHCLAHTHRPRPQQTRLLEVFSEPSSASSPSSADTTNFTNRSQVTQDCESLSCAVHTSKQGSSSPDTVKKFLPSHGPVTLPKVADVCLSLYPMDTPGIHTGGASAQSSAQVPVTLPQVVSLECSSHLRMCDEFPLRRCEENHPFDVIRADHQADLSVQTDLALSTPFSAPLSGPQPASESELNNRNMISSPLCSVVRMPASGALKPLHRSQIDGDAFMKLYKGLVSRVPWQEEPIKVISNAVLECRSCVGKRRGLGVKSDTWLLLLGPDKAGKRKVAEGLAELVFGDGQKIISVGSHSVKWDLSDDGLHDLGVQHRGRTLLDRLVEAVRLNPFSVLLLEDVDHADHLMRASFVRAMERGRLADSYGREASFSNLIVVMTATIGTPVVVPHYALKSHFWEDNVGPSQKVGMKLLVGEVVQDAALMKDGGVTVVSQHGRCQLNEALMGKVPYLWYANKRKFGDNKCLSWSTLKRSKTPVTGLMTTMSFDLNLSAEENDVEHSLEDSCSKVAESCFTYKLEQQDIDDVLDCARRVLSSNFCGAVDEIVIFHPADLKNCTISALKKLKCISCRVADLGASFEIDIDVLEQIAWASLHTAGGDGAIESWLVEVLDRSLGNLIFTQGDISGKAVRLVHGEHSPYLERIDLPSVVRLEL